MGVAAGWVIGKLVGDVMITREEIRGLMDNLLFVDAPPAGNTKLTEWATERAKTLGRHYTSELARRRDRQSEYRSNYLDPTTNSASYTFAGNRLDLRRGALILAISCNLFIAANGSTPYALIEMTVAPAVTTTTKTNTNGEATGIDMAKPSRC